jgi:hypothetical protein
LTIAQSFIFIYSAHDNERRLPHIFAFILIVSFDVLKRKQKGSLEVTRSKTDKREKFSFSILGLKHEEIEIKSLTVMLLLLILNNISSYDWNHKSSHGTLWKVCR